LVFAIFFELLSTSFLKDTNGFTNLYPSLLVVSALCVCLYLMSHTMKFIPVGIVYATWAGLGIVAITIIAVIKYKQKGRSWVQNHHDLYQTADILYGYYKDLGWV